MKQLLVPAGKTKSKSSPTFLKVSIKRLGCTMSASVTFGQDYVVTCKGGKLVIMQLNIAVGITFTIMKKETRLSAI
jgi:hypothetical protein